MKDVDIEGNVYYHCCLPYREKVKQSQRALSRHTGWWYHHQGSPPEGNVFLIYSHPKHKLYEAAKEMMRKI